MTHPFLDNTADASVDIMLDLETLSTEPNAVILSIGAVKFDPHTLDTYETLNQQDNTFYLNVDRQSCIDAGLHVSQSTIDWWAQQSQEAQDALLADPVPIKQALTRFAHWCTETPRGCRLWGNSPSFDAVITLEAFKATGLVNFPFQFWLWRDVRTVKDMAYPNGHDSPVLRVGTHHNALDDSITQAMLVQHCYKRLGLHPTEQAA